MQQIKATADIASSKGAVIVMRATATADVLSAFKKVTKDCITICSVPDDLTCRQCVLVVLLSYLLSECC